MSATVVYVAYGVDSLDLDWIPDGEPIVIVHNDDRLDRSMSERAGIVHAGDGSNRGFGGGVNLALDQVRTERIVVCNPDTVMRPEHYGVLADAAPDELVTIPLIEESGTPNSVVNRYWNAASFLATARRLGRFFPRDGRARRVLSPLLGRCGRDHAASLDARPGAWPLSQRWASGAVLSLPTGAMRAVGGFDDGFFLYYEDADLQQRLARHDPNLRLRLADVAAGVHRVGGSVAADDRDAAVGIARSRRASARRYADRQPGPAWRIAARLVGPPESWAAQP